MKLTAARSGMALLLAVLVFMLESCTSLDANTIQYAGAPRIVYDSIQPTVVFVNPWWDPNLRTATGRQLVGVAIKYQGEATQRPG